MSQNQTDDQKEFFQSLDNFRLAVYNGQTRLALENLVPVIDMIIDVLSSEEESEKEEVVKQPQENISEKEEIKVSATKKASEPKE